MFISERILSPDYILENLKDKKNKPDETTFMHHFS